MKKTTTAALLGLAVIVVAALILAGHAGAHWWAVHTGTVNESGPYYGFFSGFGSDLGEATLVVGVISGVLMAYRKLNCHEPTCRRLGLHPTADGMFHLCRHHHPDLAHLAGKKPSLEFIHNHHHAARGDAQPLHVVTNIETPLELADHHLEALKKVLTERDEELFSKIKAL